MKIIVLTIFVGLTLSAPVDDYVGSLSITLKI